MNKCFAILIATLFVLQGAFAMAEEVAEFAGEHSHVEKTVSDAHQHEDGGDCEAVAHGCHHCHVHLVSALGQFKFDPKIDKSLDKLIYADRAGGVARLLDTPPPKIA